MKPAAKPRDRIGKLLSVVLVCFGAAIVVFGLRYHEAQKREIEQAARYTLDAVADLKVAQIQQWREEMLGDANWVMEGSTLGNDTGRLSDDPTDAEALYRQSLWLNAWLKCHACSRVLLVDLVGNVMLAAPVATSKLGTYSQQYVARIPKEKRVLISDLHLSSTIPDRVNMDVFVPVLARSVLGTAGKIVGILMIEIEPKAFLYPMIEAWPTPSKTAETLLVRRDGDEVVFLNELRHRKGTALTLKVPLTNHQVPAVRAVLGEEGVVDGMDYRGVPVLAALRKIPDSPWFIVAKQDKDEILAPLRQQAWTAGTAVGGLILAVLLGLALLWRRRERLFTEQELAERKQAEAALRESEERFRTLVETAPEAIFIQSNGLFAYVNAAALKLFGANRSEELIGQPVIERIHIDQQSAVRERIRLINEQNVPAASADTVFITVDGSPKHVSTSGVPFRHQDRIGALVFARDVTERKKAEEALRQSEERLHRAIMNSPFPIMLHSEDGKVLQISNSWCEITGYTRDDLATTANWAERAYGDKRILVQAEIDQLYGLENRKSEGDYTIRTKLGDARIWEFSSAPLGRLPDGRRMVISMAMDVTERRASEREVRRLNDELERRVHDRTAELEATNKELEAFSYSVSHDLRAPLRAIDGFASILNKDFMARLDREGQRVLGIVCDEAKRMGQLIDDLLAFSRLNRQPMQSGAIDMTTLAKTVFAECAAHAPGRQLQFNLRSLPSAHGDPAMIRQVLVNLIANAIKYTRPKSPAVIEIGCRGGETDAVYYIKDNGVGFDLKYANKLFGVFQRLHTEDEFEGTGVGLALVQRIVHRHGGRVWAEAKVNEGATFFFTIPTKSNL